MTSAYDGLPAPAVKTSDTSVEAAKQLNMFKRETDKRLIANFVRNCRWTGATREEIEYGLALRGDTVRPRVSELIRDGVLYEVEGITRKTRAGRDAAVLRSTMTEPV